MIAIQTKYLGPTNNLGGRIKAWTETGHRITIGYPHEAREGAEAHSRAALALARRLGWTGELVAGAAGDGYVFTFTNGERFTI